MADNYTDPRNTIPRSLLATASAGERIVYLDELLMQLYEAARKLMHLIKEG